LLWGLTALLGKAISLDALALVFYRVVLVAALMAVVMGARRIPFRVAPRRALELGGAGVFVALHWVLFYAAVKYAGVAIAVLCLSTMTFFTALLEPVALRRWPRRSELALGIAVVVGVLLLLEVEFHASAKAYGMGLGAAFFSAAFGAWNGRLARHEDGHRVTLYELGAAGLVCGVGLVVSGGGVAPWDVTPMDWVYLMVLSVLCTFLPWLWSLRVLRTLSPYTVAISVSLEPVYSIALAALVWPTEERLSLRFAAGTALLIGLVALNGLLKRPR
jgi:drug/metabolite transporter (DMT)-like permease